LRSQAVLGFFLDLFSGDAVDPLAALRLVRDDGQAELFLEGSGKGAAHRVRLPAGGGADLADGCALGALQHPDHFGLLAVVARARLGRCRRLRPRRFGGGNSLLQFGIDFRRRLRDRAAFHAQGVVALGGDAPALAIGRDQGAVEQAVEHLFARAAFDVVGEPVDLAAAGVDGLGEDGVLGRGELGGGHGLLLRGWWMTM